jgi:hypothetical protein
MPIAYERDDERRLTTVTMIEPYSIDDVLDVIDRQAAEDTWSYSMLYDLRAVTQPSTEAELQQVANRVAVVGGGRERGPVGLAIIARPAIFRVGLVYTELARKQELGSVEVLVTAKQLEEWLARNARGGSSGQRKPT